MKLTINTSTIQNMVAKSMKGASCNKMIPLTSLMAIELKDNVLTLITTDSTNYLYVREEKVAGDDFYVVVQADVFSKLISKLTCEEVTIELSGGSMRIVGNGKYSLELPLDEEGEPIVYPNPYKDIQSDVENSELDEIHLSTVKLILKTAKSALATTLEVPCYTGYYVGDSIIATDTSVVCSIDIQLFDKPALISSETMNLLDLFTDEKIEVFRKNNVLVFKTADCIVYGVTMDGIEDYQVDVIREFVDEDYDSSCKLPKDSLLKLLDRLSLFVSSYDRNEIYLTFTRDGLQIESKKANSIEVIPYSESSNFKDFTCCVDIEMLTSQVKAYAGDAIELHYGQDNAIKLTDGNIVQVVALNEDDRVK